MKTGTFLIFLSISFISFTQKGSWYIGGTAGFSVSSKESSDMVYLKSQSWSFSPEVGVFVSPKIAIGIAPSIGVYQLQYNNLSQKTTTTNYGGSIYGRYFFGITAFKPFVGINVNATPGITENRDLQTGISTRTNSFAYGVNLNAGFAYEISERFTVIGSFGLVGYNARKSGNSLDQGFDANVNTLGNRFNIGFYYTFIQTKE